MSDIPNVVIDEKLNTQSITQISNVEEMLKRFGNKIHTFTHEDKVKGGSVKSERKSLANRGKNLKTGRHSKHVLKCNTCPLNRVCNWYEAGSVCKIQVPAIQAVMKVHIGGLEELYKEFNRTLQHLKLKILANPDERTLMTYAKLLLDYKSSRYGDRYFSLSMDLSTYLGKVLMHHQTKASKLPEPFIPLSAQQSDLEDSEHDIKIMKENIKEQNDTN